MRVSPCPPTQYFVMPQNPSPSRATTAVTLTVCFALGIGGASTGGALATRSAVAEAHAAAAAVQVELIALEDSLGRANASVRAAAFAADDPTVATATAAVNEATNSALSTTEVHEPVLTSATATSEGAATDVALQADAVVEEVLEGESQTPEDAHAATARLEQTREELDSARVLLEDEVAQLEQVRLAVKHDEALEHLDALLDKTPVLTESVRTTVENVGAGVTDTTAVDQTVDAAAAVDSAVATAKYLDRASAEQVTERTGEIIRARAVLDQRVSQLRASHEDWVAEQNIAIREDNRVVLASYDTEVERARDQHLEANREQVRLRANGWSGQPAGVTGTNGRLAWDSLCELDFAPGHRLQCAAAKSLMAANTEYMAHTGKPLELTDSYRSYSLQVRTRALKPRTAARPGTSNHGWGMAIDMNRESARWLTENGADYGWVHPAWARPGGVRPEWWHLEYVAADVGFFEEPALTGVSDLLVSVFDSDYVKPESNSENTQLTRANASGN